MNNETETTDKAKAAEQRKVADRVRSFFCNFFCRLCGREEITERQRIARVRSRRVHMANERTFLSWMRTSVGIMAFGFVVEKFGFFIKQITFFLGKAEHGTMAGQTYAAGYSSIFGIVLVALGGLMGLLAFVRYKKVEKQIDEDTYQPSLILDILLTLSIFAIGIFLIIYLIHSV